MGEGGGEMLEDGCWKVAEAAGVRWEASCVMGGT
jgi:hypothetical protein